MVALLRCSVLRAIGPRRVSGSNIIRRIAIRCSSSGLFTYWRNAFHFEHGGPRWHWIEVKTEPIIEVILQLKLVTHGICFDLPMARQR